MAVFRIDKTKDYTVMANHHLRNKALSLKAKGLLSLMLSLPDDWDYTTKGLAMICKDGVDSICSTVRELESAGYIQRRRVRDGHGRLAEIEYTIVGYLLTAGDLPKEEERGGWWIGRTFPDVSEEEFEKIGGGKDSAAIWVEWDNRWFYVLGPPVRKVIHVPKYMRSRRVPGGQFMEFRAPPSKNNTELSDSMRSTWWYAYHQWLPESEYAVDETRIPFEYYFNNDNLVYIPVKRRSPPNEGLDDLPDEN